MLLKFKICNYKSIKNIEINFTFAEKKAPNGYREFSYHPFLGNDNIRVVPCFALYGANASGKSNLIKAFDTLQKIVTTNLTEELYSPNILQDCNEITTFELSFYCHNQIFVYTLVHNAHQIINEVLKTRDKQVFKINGSSYDFGNLRHPVYHQNKLIEIFKIESLDRNQVFKKPFLAVLGKNYANISAEVSLAYTYIVEKIEIYASNKFSFNFAMSKLTDIKNSKEVTKTFARIVALLKKLDVGITKMEYEREELPKLNNPFSTVSEYSFNKTCQTFLKADIRTYRLNHANSEVSLPFTSESFGTRKLASLLVFILYVLDNGLVMVIDELENSIHPLLLAEIIRLFKDKRYNKHDAQLIFATHSTDVMDHELMRISEIGIVNKTLKNGTSIVRVSDFNGTRNVTRFRKQYLAGKFTGVPFPYI